MTTHTVPRTKDKSLTFEGELIAHAVSPAFKRHQDNPEDKCHWFEVSVYETSQFYVTSIAFRFSGPIYRENPRDIAIVVPKRFPADKAVTGFDPLQCVGGYPQGKEFDKKRKFLEESVRTDYALLVDDIENQLSRRMAPEVIQ